MKNGRLALIGGSDIECCSDYHCAGDCGLPHSLSEYQKHFTKSGQLAEQKRLTLEAFDMLESYERSERKAAEDSVRQKAKDLL